MKRGPIAGRCSQIDLDLSSGLLNVIYCDGFQDQGCGFARLCARAALLNVKVVVRILAVFSYPIKKALGV